jgi:hypothetical protein
MNTLARERDKAELLRRLRTVRADSPRRWGRMSAHQMVCHLTDCFRMATGEKAVNPSGSLRDRTIVKWIALYVPLQWPSGIVTRPEVDQECGGTAPSDFAADVAELQTHVERVAMLGRGFTWPAHPVFGRLSRAAWLRWAYRHMDHHLRQFGA